MITSSNNKRQVSYELYKLKKNKQPDHLFNLLEKSKKEKQNLQTIENKQLDFKVKEAIRRHMIEKRVTNILSSSPKNMAKGNIQVSDPIKCVQKTWVPPIQKQIMEKKFSQQQLLIQAKRKEEKAVNRQKINNILKVINLNKKMRYFGDFLSSEFDGHQRKSFSLLNIPKTKESKLTFLEGKYKKIMAKCKPKLFIMNAPMQQQKYFFNPLDHDEYFGTIMKTFDKDLMKILIKALSEQGHFSLSSFSKFYDIFVWQSASRLDLAKFAAKILMQDKQQLPITKISLKIDEVCQKINLQQLNHSLQNFSQIMKKLLFGQEFIFALKNEYFLTRKALMDSLQRNQQCISIFINVFYV